jgi:hypothetical protein
MTRVRSMRLAAAAARALGLQRQAEELAPDSLALLDRVGLRPGDSAIDMGCGPRGILELLCVSGCRQGVGSWAWTPTRATSRWHPNSWTGRG